MVYLFNCKECGGLLIVKTIEKPPEDLPKHEKLIYNRLCDVECIDCGMIYYSQPYDYGQKLNIARDIDNNKNHR